MLNVKPLSLVEIETLNELHRNHPSHASRLRAHSILLSNSKFKLSVIARAYGVCRQTVSIWLHNWESLGVCGILDAPRSGRPRMFSEEEAIKIIELVNDSPRSIKKAIAEITKTTELTPSKSTIKRICGKKGLLWKRTRKSLKSKRNPELFEESKMEMSGLIARADNNEIDLVYFDESGFTLEPCVPYAWQYRGKNIEIPSSKSKRLNVLGFVNRHCDFTSVVFEGSVTSAEVVASIDHFAASISMPTYLVMDNASIHSSEAFKENLPRWKAMKLSIVHISPYSPELNIIEILWRKIKYEWMPFSAYTSFKSLKDSLFEILSSIGKTNSIAFS